MDKYDQLAIRACKANLRDEFLMRRLRRIYGRRCALDKDFIDGEDLFKWVFDIADHFSKRPNTLDLIADAHPKNAWKFGNLGESYWDRFIFVVASFIARAEIADIPGYKEPLWWRNHRWSED